MKKFTINYHGKEIEIEQVAYAKKVHKWDNDRYAYRFKVNIDGASTERYTFYDSVFAYERGDTRFTQKKAYDMLRSIILDAQSGNIGDYPQFCDEFCYPMEKESYDCYIACKNTYEDLRRYLSDDDINSLSGFIDDLEDAESEGA